MMVKLVLRGLAAHRARLLLSALSVVAGVAFVSGTLIFSATLDRSLEDAFTDLGRGTDAVVRPAKAFDDTLGGRTAGRTVPGSALAAVEKVGGVAKARGETSGFAAVVDGRGEIVGPAPQTGVNWTSDPDLSPMRLTSGRGPAAADEIAIDSETAGSAGHRLGDRVRVALVSGTRTFTLTGIFRYGESAVGGSVAMVAFEPGTAQRLLMERPGTYTQVIVHAEDGVPPERLRDALAAALPRGAGLEAVTGRQVIDEFAEPLREILTALRTFLLVFAVIAVFVGSFLIFNTFGMLVARRTRELALLRAVGASRGQVTRSVLGEATGVGLAGSTLGLVAGGGLAYGLSRLLSAVAGEDLPFGTPVVPVSALIAAYGVGMVVTLAAAYVPARRAARIPPVAAMREETGGPRGRSLRARGLAGAGVLAAGAGAMAASLPAEGDASLYLAGGGSAAFFAGVILLGPLFSGPLTGLLGRPFARFGGVAGRLGVRNAQRSPRQTATTASALMIGLTLIGTVSVITRSMAVSVDRQLEAGLTADYRIEGRSAITPVAPGALTAAARTPGVRTAVAIRTARFALNGTVHDASAGRPAELVGHFRLRLVEGGPPSPGEDGLLVSRAVAASNGWRAGTTIPGEYQDGTRAVFRVAGVYADVTTLTPAVPTMVIDGDGYRAHDPGAALDRIELTVAPGADPAATRRALDAALAPWPNLDLKDREDVKDEAAAGIGLFLNLVLVLLALSVIVAALGIVNTLGLAVVERTREIGTLRAVGLRRSQLRRMIRYEAVIVSLSGGVPGLGLGVLFGAVVRHAMAGEGMDVLAVPYGLLAGCLLAAAFIGVVAAVWPARRAARMDVLAAMATE